MRTFVALEVTQGGVLQEIVAFQEKLSSTQADLKMVVRENLHFTIKFLGKIPQDQVDEVDKRLGALDLAPAEVVMRGVGAFPSAVRPNVIWAGIAADDRAKVMPLAEEVLAALKGIGEEDARPFEPHLTLARVRSGRNKDALASLLVQYSNHEFGVARLESLRFKSSTLTPQGPIYSDIGVYPLR